ncbi:MAG: hypothetical protein C4527_13945 [Candidatus Omnitrophota bacterium]|jgi:hypothetical protein|nr:MAG: hypothetical protein C4527_13945 [Candidatus Omnitrophota bacterium]
MTNKISFFSLLLSIFVAVLWFGWNGYYLLGPILHLRTLIAGLLPYITFIAPAYFLLDRIPEFHNRSHCEQCLAVSMISLALAVACVFLLLTCSIGYPLVLMGISGFSLFLGRSFWKRWVVNIRESSHDGFIPHLSPGTWIVLVGCLLLAIAAALTPPLGYDAHEYHLAVPQQYLKIGAWCAFPYTVYAAFPMNVEMLYLWPLAVGSAAGCTVINLLFALLACVAIFRWSRVWGEESESWTAVIIFLSTGLVLRLILQANIDLALAGCAAVLLLSYENYRRNPNRLDGVMMSVSLGFALGAKYIAVLSLLFPFCVMAFTDLCINRRRDLLHPVFFVLAGAFALVLPWLIRNMAFYHNPVYPLFNAFMNGQPPFFHDLFRVAHAPNPETVWQKAALFFQLPLQKSFQTSLQLGFSPLWLFGIPVLLKNNRNHPAFRAIVFMLTTYIVWFFVTQRNDRFLAGLLPVLAILPAYSLAMITSRKHQMIVRAVIHLIVLLQLWAAGTVILSDKSIGYLFSPGFEEDYYARHLPHYRAIAKLNHLRQEGKTFVGDVLFVGEAQTYGAQFHPIAPTVFNHHPLESGLPPSVTHVIYNASELERLRKGYGPLGWPLGEKLRAWIENSEGKYLQRIFDAAPEMPGVVVGYEVMR